jgi:hypothetical protein
VGLGDYLYDEFQEFHNTTNGFISNYDCAGGLMDKERRRCRKLLKEAIEMCD